MALAQWESFDFAIVDMVMPYKDGLAVLEELQLTQPDLLMIVITGLHSMDLLRKTLDCGAFGILSKPFTLADISELIALGNSIRRAAPPLHALSPVMHQTVELRLPTAWPMTLEIPAYLRDLARAMNFPRIISDRNIPVAIYELLQNAIVHGNKGKEDATVTVRATLANRIVTVEVEDEGEGFEVGRILNARTTPSAETKIRRGILLVRYMAEQLTYEKGGRLARVVFQATRNFTKAANDPSARVKCHGSRVN
jgi:serine/threonine-protein kinase RsbW